MRWCLIEFSRVLPTRRGAVSPLSAAPHTFHIRNRIMDRLVELDRLYRKSMQQGSAELLEAIKWARKGYNPGTREEPVKLPPDWSKRVAPDYESKKEDRPVKRPSNDRVREMMERGMKAGEIARELKMSHQKVVWAMKAIKLQRRPDRQLEMIRTGLWG